MLVSESGKYFLLGEKCSTKWPIELFRYFFSSLRCGYDYLSQLSLLKSPSLARKCFRLSLLTTCSLERKNNIFTSLSFLKSTQAFLVGWCIKLTKAKLKSSLSENADVWGFFQRSSKRKIKNESFLHTIYGMVFFLLILIQQSTGRFLFETSINLQNIVWLVQIFFTRNVFAHTSHKFVCFCLEFYFYFDFVKRDGD